MLVKIGIILLIISVVLGACLYFFSKKWEEKTVFNIQVIFRGFVYLTVIIFSIYSMHNLIWSSSKAIGEKIKNTPTVEKKVKKGGA